MFSQRKNLKDIVIELLGNGKISTLELIEQITKIRNQTTKQGVYKVLKELKQDEIIVYNRTEVALSSLWIKKLIDFTEHAQLYYAQDPEKRFDFLSLKEGEKITYAFKTFEDTDRFWIHVFDILSDTTRKSIPVMIYNPHEWFLLVRTESELYLFDRLVKKNRTLMSLVSEKDPLDIYIKKYFNNTTLQYYPIGEYVFPSKYNVNVFDDFLIEVYLDQKITDEIDGVYKKHKNWSPDVTKELTEIIRKRGKNKLVVSRSKKKSEKIRNLFRKYFAFPK